MAMVGRLKLSFHQRVLLTVLCLCWLLVGVFMIFQYNREKEFKVELLKSELQAYNIRILDGLHRGENVDSIVSRIGLPIDDLRVTLIGKDGEVIYDNNGKTPFPTANHNGRPEVVMSRAGGAGYAVYRHSESDNVDYFYSSRLGDDGIVVRTAMPYTHTLEEVLRADSTLLWVLAGITVVMSLIGYMAARKISVTIARLNRFACKAEKGESIYGEDKFPRDELGSIADHIVRLYVQRDVQHREAMRQEQDKIRLKRQLTNNINHELKTPVSAILTCMELLRDHPELAEDKRHAFEERIYNSARRLEALLRDVSMITRMEEGSGMIERKPVELSALVCRVVEEEQFKTEMQIHINVPEIEICGNKTLLESIFRNLIDNAIAYSGGFDIYIEADRAGNFIFRDNGCGISEQHLPHIFERFYRVDEGRARKDGGTGLGLAIVRHAVLFHGGDITVSSHNGLCFNFRLT